jgi:hypothetical protein
MNTLKFLISVCFLISHAVAEQSLHPFIEEYCKDAVPLETGLGVQKFGVESVTLHQGLYIELGVCGGGSINHIASLIPFQLIYGFDSFEGLPDEWDKGEGHEVIPAGSWGRDALPYVLPNVRLIKGWFKDTLPEFVRTVGDEAIAFLHVDCDIYSSTACALSTLAPMIQEGTIIVFDEFYNYPNYKNHELKAFNEFLEIYSFTAEYLAYCRVHEQVAVRIHKK